jgi:hypothetical protein
LLRRALRHFAPVLQETFAQDELHGRWLSSSGNEVCVVYGSPSRRSVTTSASFGERPTLRRSPFLLKARASNALRWKHAGGVPRHAAWTAKLELEGSSSTTE